MSLDEIIERLATTDKPDARINAFLTCMFHLKGLRPAEPDDFDGKFGYYPHQIKTEHGFLMAHPYTSDLNEAADLVDKILPGRFWHFAKGRIMPNEPLYGAFILEADEVEHVLGEAESNHPALALTLAALRAYKLIRKEGEQ